MSDLDKRVSALERRAGGDDGPPRVRIGWAPDRVDENGVALWEFEGEWLPEAEYLRRCEEAGIEVITLKWPEELRGG